MCDRVALEHHRGEREEVIGRRHSGSRLSDSSAEKRVHSLAKNQSTRGRIPALIGSSRALISAVTGTVRVDRCSTRQVYRTASEDLKCLTRKKA